MKLLVKKTKLIISILSKKMTDLLARVILF